MKNTAMALIGALLLLQCSQFPDRFDRIETNVIRPIGFVYDPYTEGAPGDTIHLHAYFGGDPVVLATWQLSYNELRSATGNQDTVVDYAPLATFGLTGNLPDSLDFSFVIPDSAFFLTKAITNQALAALRGTLPSAMAAMTQQDFAAFLQAIGAINVNDTPSVLAFLQQWGARLGIAPASPAAIDSLAAVTEKVVSVFSIQGIVLATVRDSAKTQLQIRGQFTIRYNRRFRNTALAQGIPVNNNPVMHWVGIYIIKSNSDKGFSPGDSILAGKYTPQYLYNDFFPAPISDTVIIDTGYTYFFGADSGITTYMKNNVVVTDTGRDKYVFYDTRTGRDTFQLETWFYDWEFQNVDLDSVTLPQDSLLLLTSGGQESYIKFLPSLDTKMTHAKLWVTAYDQYLGELNRPAGFTIRNFDVYFKYSAAYRAKHP